MARRKWTTWIEHAGGGCPLPPGIEVQEVVERAPAAGRRYARFTTVEVVTGDPQWDRRYDWRNWGRPTPNGLLSRVVRYRTRRYQAAAALIESLSGIIDVPEEETKESRYG